MMNKKEGAMKAVQIDNYGSIDELKVVDIETPTPGKGQVQVEVHASSVNPIETIVREGRIPVDHLPATLGGDFAGVVSAVGDDVAGFAVGDKVFGQASVLAGNSGAYAEYAVTSAIQIGQMPKSATFEQAASLPLVGVSAIQALEEHIRIKKGQKLFIHGGAGGIGSIAVQMAKHHGAFVATTATGDGVVFVKALGADQVIDYAVESFADVLADFDAVYDTVGGDDFQKALTVLKKGGVAVSMTAHVDDATASRYGVTAISQQTHVTTDMLGRLATYIDDGIIKPQIDAVFSLDEVVAAFEARESGRIKGKVVLIVKGNKNENDS
jgi:NADPH:quinone reductase-like Zn-dependent oxidoreductase